MSCTHSIQRSEWVEEEDWFDGEVRGEWKYWTESCQVDIDLHRYKCTQCGEIGYYSGAARKYHEEGIKSDIQGLDK